MTVFSAPSDNGSGIHNIVMVDGAKSPQIGVYHASELDWTPLNLDRLTEAQAQAIVQQLLILLTPVTDLLLSKRAENCLLRSEIYYRGQLRICQKFNERGLGVKSITEILTQAKIQWNEDLPYLRRLGRERYGLI